MSRLSGGAQWGIIIGLWVVQRVLRAAAEKNPELGAFVWPILVVYLAFVVLTWLSTPLFNLMLRFDRFGRYAPVRRPATRANLVAGCAGSGTVMAAVAWGTGNPRLYFVRGPVRLLAVSRSAIYGVPAGWPRRAMWTYSAAMVPRRRERRRAVMTSPRATSTRSNCRRR
jgi:hypothetical protein